MTLAPQLASKHSCVVTERIESPAQDSPVLLCKGGLVDDLASESRLAVY